jgi:hypothetical protein
MDPMVVSSVTARFRTWPCGIAIGCCFAGVVPFYAALMALHYTYKAGRLLGPVADWIGGSN